MLRHSRRSLAPLAAALLAACGGSEVTGAPHPAACPAGATALAAVASPALPLALGDARGNAAPGTATLDGTGMRAFHLAGAGASSFEAQRGSVGFSVLDAYATDAERRPTAELFVLLRQTVAPGQVPLTPVSVGQLHDPMYFPSGAIAAWGEAYDGVAGDYSRWLVARAGCVSVTRVDTGAIGRVLATVTLDGEWQDAAGARLGDGALTAELEAPLLRLSTPTSRLVDTLAGAMEGARAAPLTVGSFGGAFGAYQVLRPGQTRLAIVASPPADSASMVHELWLSLPGVPQAGDSVPLRLVGEREARDERSDSAFALVRFEQLPAQTMKELWRSTGGYVKLTSVVQSGPAALCGWASGRFAFRAVGTDPSTTPGTPIAAPGTSSADTLVVHGTFETRLTILPPWDSIADRTTLGPTGAPPRAHQRASGQRGCDY